MASSSTLNFDRQEEPSPSVVRHKRRNAALSCAECRRLKLKCSRMFPCTNCVKKGCSAICPDGSLTTGKGNRFVLANTEALHEKISQLANRVRQLEDALAHAHASLSNEPHPLLSEELLQIKRPLERERLDSPPAKEEKPESNDEIAIGSLSISQRGRTTFFGQTANAWYLLQNEEGSDEDDDSAGLEPPLPSDVPWLSYAFPFNSSVAKTADGVRGSIISLLPRLSVARKFANLYFRHAAWMYTPISELEFYDTIFRPVYDPDASYHEAVESHNIAVLYMVLALGTLMDLDRPSHSSEATQYYQLGRAALALDPVFEVQSIPAIQALLLMCHFMFLADMEARWSVMGLVVKLAQSAGLHRDSGKWNLSAEDTHRRRCLMYEIYTYDSWQSLTFGRPPSFSMSHIDCKFPDESTKNSMGEVEMSFSAWKHRFSSQCQSVVQDQVFGARTPSYKVVQDLARRVRDFYMPPSLRVPGFGGAELGSGVEQPTTELTMQRYTALAIKEMTLFYMHRGFFARALEDSPTDAMSSKYAPSVLAAYTSACSFVGLIESLFRQHPGLTERMWFLFTHVFSCSIVLGSIAVKSRMALAPSALSHLESAHNLFQKVSENPRAAKVLPILRKLRERAHIALSNSTPRTHPDPRSYFTPSIKNEVDELSALGGMTRLVSRKSPSSPSTPSYTGSPPSASSQPATTPPPHQHSMIDPASTTSWQDYSHIQDFNDYSTYTVPLRYPQNDGSLAYALQAEPQQSMAMVGVMSNYQYGPYQDVPLQPYRSDYSQSPQMMRMSGDSIVPAPDLNTSWQNLMAQFK